MNYTKKPSSISIPRDLSLVSIFVISITYLCIVREPSNWEREIYQQFVNALPQIS